MSAPEKKTNKTSQKAIAKTLSGIPFEEAKLLINNYATKLGRNANGGHNNTISVWFPIQQFVDLAKRLEKEATASATANPKRKVDGIRVYFANYGATPPEKYPEYAHKDTVVFISTHQDEVDNNRHRDYFTEGVPKLKAKDTNPENRGILCPPNTGCDCSSEIFNDPICEEKK